MEPCDPEEVKLCMGEQVFGACLFAKVMCSKCLDIKYLTNWGTGRVWAFREGIGVGWVVEPLFDDSLVGKSREDK